MSLLAMPLTNQPTRPQGNRSQIPSDFQTYFSLSKPSLTSPLHSWAPYLIFCSLVDPKQARFATIQRRQVQTFRSEIIRSGAWSSLRKINLSEKEATDLCSLKGESCFIDEAIEMFEKSDNLNHSQIRDLTRLLDSLALYDDAEAVISKHKNRSPLLMATWILSANFRSYGRGTDLIYLAIKILNELPREPIYFQCRFAIYTMLIVASGQRKLIDLLNSLEEIGPKILTDINSLDSSDFHKSLHISKFYRATSYVPFVRNDRDELKRRRELIYTHACLASPRDAVEELILKENFMPVLETCAKIDSFLGDNDSALQLLKMLPNKIDPYDLKAWMQLGDFQRSIGLKSESLESYKSGFSCGAPHMHILNFKIGQSYESMGAHDLAVKYYKQSLDLEPFGFSAFVSLFRVYSLTGHSNINEIRNYCCAFLEDGRLTENQKNLVIRISTLCQ